MKNSNERIPFFDNLPTADEAERMEAAVSEADHGEYNETAVTNLALAGMQAERNQAADHTELGIPGKTGDLRPPGTRSRIKLRTHRED